VEILNSAKIEWQSNAKDAWSPLLPIENRAGGNAMEQNVIEQFVG
jgi:hypothetical protein